jgi:hypothetical protein
MTLSKTCLLMAVLAGIAIATPSLAHADRAKEFLVPPEGGSYEVLVYPDFVTVLDFSEKLSTKALASDTTSYEVKAYGETAIAVRPLKKDAKPATLSLSTQSGAIKVSVILRIATKEADAWTFVHFAPQDTEAALEKRIEAEVEKRTAALTEELRAAKAAMDAELPKHADELIATRILQRYEIVKLDAIERNDDNVIVRVKKVLYLGDRAYLSFEIENQSRAAYRLASVQVLGADKTDHAGVVRFASTAAEAVGAGMLGVVANGSKGNGVVVLQRSEALLGTALTLVVAQPDGRSKVEVGRIVLK